MSAKLLHSLSGENPDLQKQIGCMSGIFQLFDRHHFLSARRTHHHNHNHNHNHKGQQLPPHPASSGGEGHGRKKLNTALQRPPPTEKNQKKAMTENQGTSTEPSITSFSSSASSPSLSSIHAKQSHPEPSSYAPKNVPGTPTRDLPISQPNNSLQLSRPPVDLRDVDNHSMYREAREISIRSATKDKGGGQTLKYMDSPRPLVQPKSFKSRDSSQIESFRVLAKLREAPWSSNEWKDGFAPKDAPRFSYDGRESRESIKSTIKLKEFPRLSLDGKVHSMRGSTMEMKSNYLLGDMQSLNGNSTILNQQQEPGSNKRPSSLVAKLMGLEAFPDSMSTNRNQPNQIESFPDVQFDAISGLSKTTVENKQNRISGSPRNSIKEPVSPRRKNANSVKKPNSSSKFPIEPAPWKQQEGSKGQTPASQSRETPTRASNSSLSVYGEIEKRLAQLEFKKSGKDLRALKQILEAMQKTKEILESREEDQASNLASQTGDKNSVDPSSILANSNNLKGGTPTSTKTKRICSPKSFRSPIVVTKAAKPIEKTINPASLAIQKENLSGLQRLRIGDPAAGRKESVEKQTKDPTQRSNYLQDPSSRPLHHTNKDTSAKSLRLGQTSKSSHPTTGDPAAGRKESVEKQTKDPTQRSNYLQDPSSRPLHHTNKDTSAKSLRLGQTSKSSHPTTGKTNSRKRSESLNPRLEQKELKLEKQSHSRMPSSDLSRSRRQHMESASLLRKSRSKSQHLQQSDDQWSDISVGVRYLTHPGDASSLQSGSYISMGSYVSSEVSSTDRPDKISGAFFLQHGQTHPPAGYIGDKSTAEPGTVGPEQPSPVSVLDATFYRDEPPSPVRKISHAFTDDEAEWSPVDLNHITNCRKPSFCSENDYNKLQNMKHLDQNDMHINPTHEKSITDEIAPNFESKDPNHRYISEILLASGFLRDFESDFMTIKPNPSGHLINPNLFFILEQTEACIGLPNDLHEGKKITHAEPTTEKAQRKLVFDAVNEILIHKLLLQESSKKWLSPSKLARGRSSGEQLLRDLCSEVDCLQANNSNCNLDGDNDNMTSIIWEDLKHGSTDWPDCQSEISWLVLDVERLIFKDLINEIVCDETASLRAHPRMHCRQLFSR